ncbi:MAG: L,D-transpeptidase [Alphaproteobacteria bacterium]|nr:L,D-transpeptidase [Alphaproteobacteria bacterium]
MRNLRQLLLVLPIAVISFASFPSADAEASVTVKVDRGAQTMHVYVDGYLQHSWAISTGRRGYTTPSGVYRPTRLERMWHSRKYHWSPMPYSIFFRGGYAIHGTNETGRLGRRASHGCIRLHPSNARQLFSLVSQYGRSATRIHIR